MNIPTVVKVGGTWWDIIDGSDDLKENHNYGETRVTKDTIALDTRGRKSESIHRTLLHEIIHACEYTFLPPDQQLNETQVTVLAAALHTLLTTNPNVADFVLGRWQK